MKLKNVKKGVRVQYKGNVCKRKGSESEHVPVGCLGTIKIADGTDRPLVNWDNRLSLWTLY